MKKTYYDNIILCSNRVDRQIPPHYVSGMVYTDPNGFVIFELEQTHRDFVHDNISISEGCFLITEDSKCCKIVSIEFAVKRPKHAFCKTVLTSINEIPLYNQFKFVEGTFEERKHQNRKSGNNQAKRA